MSSNDGEKSLESPALLQDILNVIPAHAWYASSSGGLTFVNKRTADYLGLPEKHPLRFGEDIGASWDAVRPFLHPDDVREALDNWSTRLSTGGAGEGGYRVRDAQGAYRWFLGRAEPLRASDGTLLRWVGLNLDFGKNPEVEEPECAEPSSRESSTNPLDNRRLGRVLDHIEEHLDDEIAVTDLANIACLSVFHFRRAFAAAVGIPPNRYITQRRMERAKAMIAAQSTSIAETALLCRFSSQASFTRAFRRATGMPPALYQRMFSSNGRVPGPRRSKPDI